VKGTLQSPTLQWRRRPIRRVKRPYSLADLGLELSAGALSFGALCCLLLWVSINTGPWNLQLDLIQGSWTGFFNGVRAAFPIAILAAWFFHILIRKQRSIRSFTWPETLWLYYGIVTLIAGFYADPWFDYSYWGFAYLSAFAATEIYMQESPTSERAGALNRLNWVLGSAVLLIVAWVARGQLSGTNIVRAERLWSDRADADGRRDGDGAGIGNIAARGGTGDSCVRTALENARS
jgi:hypothetical protein